MRETTASPISVFDDYGLLSKGGWAAEAIPVGDDGTGDPALSLCRALEKLGGLYSLFGHFLSWRADLVDTACISHLRDIKLDLPPIRLSVVASIIHRELGDAANELAASLEDPPLWNTYNRTAYLSRLNGQAMVVQVARDPIKPEQFAAFEQSMRAIRHPNVTAAVADVVLAQFQEWVRNGEGIPHERRFLDAIGHHQGETLAAYPRPIPEYSSPAILCWLPAAGRSVAELVGDGNPAVVPLVAGAILEQFYSLAIVEANPDLRAMIVDANNRLHFRYLSNPVAVPAGRINNGIKYTSAVLAGNAMLSAQSLIRMVHSHPALDLESTLMDEFSAVEPELKVHRWFPPSASSFESNWRALARLEPARPLFLDCFLRNFVATGYWNSDTELAGAVRVDAIEVAQPIVVQRMLKTETNLLMNKGSAQEWAMGSGLLAIGTLREANRLLEEVRESDLTFGVDTREPVKKQLRPDRMTPAVTLACLLAVLLASLLFGGTVPAPWPMVLKIVAVATLPGLFWAVWRIG